MSLKEFRPRSGGFNLNRSSTYDGPRRQAGSPPSSSGSPGILILGQAMKSPKASKKSGGTKKGNKVPKVPRPARTTVMFSSIKKGLQECIEATEQDVASLRAQEPSSSTESTVGQARLYEIDKQIKAAERYKKKLEFHLSKIEELEDNYALQQQLREGAKTMARAYTSSGSSSRQTVANVKHGFKECTQAMCAIEADLENMLGTFHCKMRGMVGFARLVPGDVFEVTVRHGFQKWKTKGRIKVDAQHWDTENAVFKALVGDVFLIKALEQKSLAKSVILGQKNCDTKELFSANPQMMTININANGSLKLSIVITWSPLEGIDETVSYFEPPPKQPSTPKRRPPISPALLEHRHSSFINRETEDAVIISSVTSSPSAKGPAPSAPVRPQSNIETKVNNLESEHVQVKSRPASACAPQRSSSSVTTHKPTSSRPVSAFDALPATRHSFSSVGDTLDANHRKNKLFDMRLLADSLENTSPMRQELVSLEDAVHTLSSTLEDYQGQYPELQQLEEQILLLDRLLKRNSGGGSGRSSNVSISVEAALGAFDFLEKEEATDGYASSNNSRRSSFDKFPTAFSLSPESTTKTADSGIESIANRFEDEVPFDGSSPSSPEPPSTGSEQVDQALLWHLGYCERLMENLGNYGPMKCKEIYSLDRLQIQADILGQLVAIAEAGNKLEDFQKVLDSASKNKDLQDLWKKCVSPPGLCTTVEQFTQQLDILYGSLVKTKYSMDPAKVFRCLCCRILDVSSVDPSQTAQKLTLYQVFSYFTDGEDGELTVNDALQDLAGELLINQRLKSADSDVVIKTVQTFHDTLPPTDCLRVAALLLITKHSAIQGVVASYLCDLCSSDMLRRKAILAYVESLEDRNADVRCAACMALGHLKATEAIDQLVYMCQNDSSNVVQSIAKDTLISFGEEGQQALRQVQLSSHGFQGVRL